MVDVTLFEVHLDDSTLSANAPSLRRKRGGRSERDESSLGTSQSGGKKGKAVKAGAIVLAVVAVALVVRRLRGGSDEESYDVTERTRDRTDADRTTATTTD